MAAAPSPVRQGPSAGPLVQRAAPPSVVCRSSQAKEPIEWQADFYASCLLMPRKLVMTAWDEIFPDRKPRVRHPCTPFSHPFVEIPRISCHIGDLDCSKSEGEALDRFARPLAERFLFRPSPCAFAWRSSGFYIASCPVSGCVKNSISWLPESSNENDATLFFRRSSSVNAVATPFGSGCPVPPFGIDRSWSVCQQKTHRRCTWKARTSS